MLAVLHPDDPWLDQRFQRQPYRRVAVDGHIEERQRVVHAVRWQALQNWLALVVHADLAIRRVVEGTYAIAVKLLHDSATDGDGPGLLRVCGKHL